MSSNSISTELRKLVINRASGRCEYCLIHSCFSIYTHEVDHIIAVKHGSETVEENLALSCLSCNRHKGSDFATIDAATGEIVPLFNPRRQIWDEHFYFEGARIKGKTQIGQATARLLQFNLPNRLLQRQALISQQKYP
ncbi:HNH endonuclease signature motif containing protein [Chlorogloeopsis sp. ULAP01]|jgi:5-methylcytosine-specific restriction endonuclease McrA|uniref:HNH endonuclease n=1 Tax=Chlorogloeopsis sp. ULAP01 TaxID=3056483 RepID=UPI0025AB3C83|nr:HNH endonuclease signature motif containing protein [Chlorogloeopsis sp. ULAP01]MDM9383490.1 HNH endonuclease signature motif containing protein [Chlorogloeopsis sp. ULAP01]